MVGQQRESGLRRIVHVDTHRRQVVDDAGSRLEAVHQVSHRFLVVLDYRAAINKIMISDELRQIAHAVAFIRHMPASTLWNGVTTETLYLLIPYSFR